MDKALETHLKVDDEISLRTWTVDDVDRALEIVLRNRDHLQTWMQWMTVDYSIEHAKKFIADAITSRIERKTLALAILRNDRLVGSTGFNRLDWLARVCEIGYWIDRDEEGKGIVTRACRRMIAYAFDDLKMNRVEIRCSAENVRSAAVPERLGFRKEGVLRQAELISGELHDFNLYGLLAQDPRLW